MDLRKSLRINIGIEDSGNGLTGIPSETIMHSSGGRQLDKYIIDEGDEDEDEAAEMHEKLNKETVRELIANLSYNIKRTRYEHGLLYSGKFLNSFKIELGELIYGTSGIYVASRDLHEHEDISGGRKLNQKRQVVLSMLNSAQNEPKKLEDIEFVKKLLLCIDSWLAEASAQLHLFIPEADPSQSYS